MHLSPIMTIMHAAAQAAAKNLLHDFNEVEHLQVSLKGPGDFVSQADLNAERILREKLERARPSYAFLMEESGAFGNDHWTWRWVVDPLDGTTNFLHGIPHWAISIGLQRQFPDGRSDLMAGLVYNPVAQEMFWAEKGSGAYLNERRIRVSARKNMQESLFATGFAKRISSDKNSSGKTSSKEISLEESSSSKPHFLVKTPSTCIINHLIPRVAGIRRFGSAALDLAWVAAGRYEGYWEFGIKPWDCAAGILLVREAGGLVTDPNGNHFNSLPDSIALIAGNTHIHKKLQEVVTNNLKSKDTIDKVDAPKMP